MRSGSKNKNLANVSSTKWALLALLQTRKNPYNRCNFLAKYQWKTPYKIIQRIERKNTLLATFIKADLLWSDYTTKYYTIHYFYTAHNYLQHHWVRQLKRLIMYYQHLHFLWIILERTTLNLGFFREKTTIIIFWSNDDFDIQSSSRLNEVNKLTTWEQVLSPDSYGKM